MEKSDQGSASLSPVARFGPWAILALALVLAGVIRIRLMDTPLERDEGEFAYAGQLMLEGVPPYREACNMKLPGIYAAYAALMLVFGQTPAGIHFGLLLVSAGGAVMIFLTVRRLLDAWVGAMAAAAYLLLAASPCVLGQAGHATHFVVLFAFAGLWLLLRGMERQRWVAFLGSGLLLGLAILMKQPGFHFLVLAGLYLVWTECRLRPIAWRRLLGRVGLLAAGGVAPFGLTCLLLWWAGVFERFWFWTFDYAVQYGSVIPVSPGIGFFFDTIPDVMGPWVGLWALAGVGLVTVVADRRTRPAAPLALGLAVFSLLATSAGFYWRQHYFVLLLPAVAVLAAVAIGSLTRWASDRRLPVAVRVIPAGVFLAVLAYGVAQERAYFFQMSPPEACRAVYWANPFTESLEIARYLREHTSPGDRVAVIGSEPQVYFYAHRRSATSYMYTYALMEPQPYAGRMQREMIAEIEASRPAYIVFVNIPTSWLARPESDRTIFQWFLQYAQKNYEPRGVIDILSPNRTVYVWGGPAAGYAPRSPYKCFLVVFKRKAEG